MSIILLLKGRSVIDRDRIRKKDSEKCVKIKKYLTIKNNISVLVENSIRGNLKIISLSRRLKQ